jgi:hypothetical protein
MANQSVRPAVPEGHVDYGDSFDIEWGTIGDPRWPAEITVRLFRRNERNERLIVDERRYARVDEAHL